MVTITSGLAAAVVVCTMTTKTLVMVEMVAAVVDPLMVIVRLLDLAVVLLGIVVLLVVLVLTQVLNGLVMVELTLVEAVVELDRVTGLMFKTNKQDMVDLVS
tara:strand:- start:72 stop:377 length:306 start_codon:yes stop_codon:yes gene_type:complete